MKLQANAFSCGPVALFNAHWHLFGRWPRVTLNSTGSECKLDKHLLGVCRENLLNPEWAQRILHSRPETSTRRIKKMSAFVLLYSLNESAHYVFVVKEESTSGGSFLVYNYMDPITYSYRHERLSSREFDRMLSKNPSLLGRRYPIAWEVI